MPSLSYSWISFFNKQVRLLQEESHLFQTDFGSCCPSQPSFGRVGAVHPRIFASLRNFHLFGGGFRLFLRPSSRSQIRLAFFPSLLFFFPTTTSILSNVRRGKPKPSEVPSFLFYETVATSIMTHGYIIFMPMKILEN